MWNIHNIHSAYLCQDIDTRATRLRALGSLSNLRACQIQRTLFHKQKGVFFKNKKNISMLFEKSWTYVPQCSRVSTSMTMRFFFIWNIDKLIALRISSFHIKTLAFQYWKFLDSFLIFGCLYCTCHCLVFVSWHRAQSSARRRGILETKIGSSWILLKTKSAITIFKWISCRLALKCS